MSQNSKIEWTDATWNPTRGCSRVSEGCRNCYAERIAARFSGAGETDQSGEVILSAGPFHTFAERTPSGPRWTGKVELVESMLMEPLHWRKPRRVFVNSMSDLFHEALPDEAIDRVFAVMALCPQHTFQILTKRPERAEEWFQGINVRRRGFWCEHGGYLHDVAVKAGIVSEGTASDLVRQAVKKWKPELPVSPQSIGDASVYHVPWPLQNVWLGVSVENQETADARIRSLLKTPAAVRFVSYEPALRRIQFDLLWLRPELSGWFKDGVITGEHPLAGVSSGIDWIIMGGESGPGARPLHPAWVRGIRDMCQRDRVPFFFKQWGEYQPLSTTDGMQEMPFCDYNVETKFGFIKAGKKAAGAILDGREWRQFPVARTSGALQEQGAQISDPKNETGSTPQRGTS